MKKTICFIIAAFICQTIFSQSLTWTVGLTANSTEFKTTNPPIFFSDLGFNTNTNHNGLGVSLGLEKRFSPVFVLRSMVNLHRTGINLWKPEVFTNEGGSLNERLALRFATANASANFLWLRDNQKRQLSPLLGLSASVNRYMGVSYRFSARQNVTATGVMPDFEELYPTTVDIGINAGLSYRFYMSQSPCDLFVLMNYALTEPFGKSLGRDTNNKDILIGGNLRIWTLGMNMHFGK